MEMIKKQVEVEMERHLQRSRERQGAGPDHYV
jgi:hypothetical protein